MKKSKAIDWTIIQTIDQGSFIEVLYECPHCNQNNFEQVLSNQDHSKPFTIHHVCTICNKLNAIHCNEHN